MWRLRYWQIFKSALLYLLELLFRQQDLQFIGHALHLVIAFSTNRDFGMSGLYFWHPRHKVDQCRDGLKVN